MSDHPNPHPNPDAPTLYQDALGRPVQAPQSGQVPRTQPTRPNPSSSASARRDSSAASAGSQSPVYTHRERTPSFASGGSSGYGGQYGGPARSTQTPQVAVQSYRYNVPTGRGPGASYSGPSGTANLSTQIAGMTVNPNSNQTTQFVNYQTRQTPQLGTSPRSRDWYQPNPQPRAFPDVASPSTSQAALVGSSTQRTGQPGLPPPRRVFQPTRGEYEALDNRFKRRPGKWFRRGRVFKMHWAEPAGREGDDNATVVTPVVRPFPKKRNLPRGFVRDPQFGEYIYSKIRWFIVVRPGQGKCLCIPIITYRGQGVAKPGVVKNEHAVVHTSKVAPKPKSGEYPEGNDEKPMRTPIRVKPDDTGDQFMEMSRIDYSRIYTVESYVKARAFGWVHEESEKDLFYDFREVIFGSEWSSDMQSGRNIRDDDSSEENAEDNAHGGSDGEEDDEEEDDDAEDTNARSAQSKGKAPVRPARMAPGPSSVTPAQVQTAMQQRLTDPAAAASQTALQAARVQQQRNLALHAAQIQDGASRHSPSRQATTVAAAQDSEEEESDEESEDERSEGEEEETSE